MKRYLHTIPIRLNFWVAALVLMSGDVSLQADDSSAAVTIEINPTVGRYQIVHGTLQQPGFPVVLVRADQTGEPWWVQNPAEPAGRNGFIAKAVFGSDRTPAGAAFRVVVLLTDPARTVFRTGQQITELPDVPKSAQLLVRLIGGQAAPVVTVAPPVAIPGSVSPEPGPTPAREPVSERSDRSAAGEANRETDADGDAGADANAKAPRLVEILSPKSGATGDSPAELTARIERGFVPVALVRPVREGGVWYVQRAPEFAEDDRTQFHQNVTLGNNRTPDGSEFRVVILAFASAKEAARLKRGLSLRKLPDDVAVSEELVLKLNRKAARVTASTTAPSDLPLPRQPGGREPSGGLTEIEVTRSRMALSK